MIKKIKDFENYGIDSKGNVYSFNFAGKKDNIKIMKKTITENGYYRIALKNKNGYKKFFVHRLVAEYFLEKVDNKKFVNHKDCNKLNNNVENLEWCTISENTKHAWDNNKMNLNGIKNGRSKLSLKDIEEIRNSKESVSFLSKKFKVCNKTIYKVKNKISYI